MVMAGWRIFCTSAGQRNSAHRKKPESKRLRNLSGFIRPTMQFSAIFSEWVSKHERPIKEQQRRQDTERRLDELNCLFFSAQAGERKTIKVISGAWNGQKGEYPARLLVILLRHRNIENQAAYFTR